MKRLFNEKALGILALMALLVKIVTDFEINAISAKMPIVVTKMNQDKYKYEFDKNRSRVEQCPCGKSNKDVKFAPYVDYEDKGHCFSCGKTFRLELSNIGQWNSWQSTQSLTFLVKKQSLIDFIPPTIFQELLINGNDLYNQNNFIQWLGNEQRGKFAFDSQTIEKLIEIYFLGNSRINKHKGWVLFPYIDIQGRVRDIKAMDYNSFTGKRIKEPYPKCLFIGKEVLNNPNANTERCFFGEHLLKGNKKPVKIFESEASAVYAAAFYPEYVCLATGGKYGCKWTKKDICTVLQGRQIILYPDIDGHESWEEIADILRGYGLNVQVSQIIKNSAIKYAEQHGIDYSELVNQKYDLRDFLKDKDLKDFIKPATNSHLIEHFVADQASVEIDALPLREELGLETELHPSEPPLNKATGRLAILENEYLKLKTRDIKQLEFICRLFDKYKRIGASKAELDDLECLIKK
ncbi:DUF6371 domain-containing protein [Solitalea agri]|nr:DUF6371 domain-containing protein [Solitalea agri]